MEDTHRAQKHTQNTTLSRGLNPCSNGRYSQSASTPDEHKAIICLNPCSNGRYSQRLSSNQMATLLSSSLNPCSNGRYSQSKDTCGLDDLQ